MEDIANLVFKKMKYLHIRRAVPDKLGYLISQYCNIPRKVIQIKARSKLCIFSFLLSKARNSLLEYMYLVFEAQWTCCSHHISERYYQSSIIT